MRLKSNETRWGLTLAKLLATAASVAAIAFAVATLQPDGTVRPGEADVLDLTFGDKPRSEQFPEVLQDLGLPRPEAFDMNGNVMYFTSDYAKGSPRDILERYQRKFAETGFNTRQYTAPRDGNQVELFEGALIGDMVPVDVSDRRVVMMSATLEGEPRSTEELARLTAGKSVPETFDEYAGEFVGHRWMEIVRDDAFRDRSLVTASWSDDFDLRKMDPDSRGLDVSFDPNLPACPGCQRSLTFDKLDAGPRHDQSFFTGASSPDGALRYYLDAMKRRGWRQTESSAMYEEVRRRVEFEGDDARILQLARGDEFMMIMAYPREGDTAVHVIQSN